MASTKQPINPLSELHRQLLSPRTLQAYDSGSAINLFRAFNLTGFDYNGQLTSGFGERGTKVSLDVSWDFGDLILPGVLSAKVEAGASAAKTRYTLIFVARQPKKLKISKNWTTMKPLCLSIMKGYAAKMTASAGVSASATPSLGVDELGLEVSAAAGGDIGGRVINLRDEDPHFYASPWDASLALDFDQAVDVLTRRQVKNMIDAWLKDKVKENRMQEKARKVLSDQLGLEDKEEEIGDSIKEQIPRSDWIEQAAEDAGVTVSAPTWGARLKNFLRPPKSAGLLSRLDELEKKVSSKEEPAQSDDDALLGGATCRNQRKY